MNHLIDYPTSTIKVILDDKNAVLPTKAHPSDTGYDLTAIKIHKKVPSYYKGKQEQIYLQMLKNSMTTLYDTGIIVKPSEGYYTEIIPRSSISKTGYILANSVGIIDNTYRGHLLIALTKIDNSKPDLKVPFCKCQLVVRKIEPSRLVQVSSFEEEKTERDEGGFGSTDK